MTVRLATMWIGTAIATALMSAAAHAQAPLRAQLIVHWRLVSTETVREGEPPASTPGDAPLGSIVYTPDGHVLAQLTATGRARVRPTDATPAEARALARYTVPPWVAGSRSRASRGGA